MYHICFVYIYPLNGYRELNSFEEPCFTLVTTITSLATELKPTGVGEHTYCHSQTDCFVVSQLFSVASKARFPKLGSKHGWLKRQSKILYIYWFTSLATELKPTGVGEHTYCHSQTDCFVVSQLFSVASKARFPKLGSKHGWLKRQSKILYIYWFIHTHIHTCVQQFLDKWSFKFNWKLQIRSLNQKYKIII